MVPLAIARVWQIVVTVHAQGQRLVVKVAGLTSAPSAEALVSELHRCCVHVLGQEPVGGEMRVQVCA